MIEQFYVSTYQVVIFVPMMLC